MEFLKVWIAFPSIKRSWPCEPTKVFDKNGAKSTMISRKSGHTEPEKYYNLKYIHKMKSILNFPALNSILDFIVLCHSLPFFLHKLYPVYKLYESTYEL